MALNVGRLVAELDLDDTQYHRKVDAGESRFSRMAGFMAGAAKTVVAAGTAGLVAAGTVGLSTAANMEQAEIGFSTMLGSGEKAKAFLDDLSGFAAKTPFEFPELQTAASSLVSAGVEAGRVIPIMTSLGNATSGMGTGSEGVKRATVALQQMNAAGKITGEDLNQLRDAGIPVYDLLAAATGKSKEQVAELAAKGKLGRVELEQLMGALESGKGLERFTGLMEKQSTSLTGLWSTLKDTLSVGMATAIQPLVPLIKDGLGGAITFVTNNMPRIASGLASVVNHGRLAYSILFQGDYTGGLVGGLEEDSGAVNVLFTIRETALGVYDILFRGDFTGGFLGLEEDSPAIGVLFSIREAALSLWAALRTGDLEQLRAGLAGAGDAGVGMLDMLGALGGLLPDLTTLIGAGAAVVGFLADHSDTLVTLLPLLVAGFVAYKTAIAAGNIAALASVPIAAAQAASNFALAAAIRASGAAATTSAVQQVAAAQVTHTSMLKTGVLAIATAATVVGGWIASAAAATASAAAIAIAWLVSLGPVGLVIAAVAAVIAIFVVAWKNSETFRDVVTGAFNMVKDVIGGVVGGLITYFSTLLGAWLSAASAIVGAAAWVAEAMGMQGVADKLRGAQGHIDAFKASALGALNDLRSQAYGMGENTGQGLANGLTAKQGVVRSAARDLAQAARGGMQGVIRAQSPSRMSFYLGEMVAEGLIVAMDGKNSRVAAAAGRMAVAALPNVGTVRLPTGAVRGSDGPSAVGSSTSTAHHGDRTLIVHNHNPAPETGSESVNKTLRRLEALGPVDAALASV